MNGFLNDPLAFSNHGTIKLPNLDHYTEGATPNLSTNLLFITIINLYWN